MSCARSAPPPGTPAWPACAPTPRPEPPGSAASHAEAARQQRPGRQLPGSARGVPAARGGVRRHHGRPRRLGQGHRSAAAPGRGRRRRTAPPSPRPALPAAAVGRTRPATDAQRDELTRTAEQPAGTPAWIKELAAAHRTFAATLADRHNLMIPSQDPDYGDLGPAFPLRPGPGRTRSCSRPHPRLRRPRTSCSVPPTGTSNGRPPIDGARSPCWSAGGDRNDRDRYLRCRVGRRAAADVGPRPAGSCPGALRDR